MTNVAIRSKKKKSRNSNKDETDLQMESTKLNAESLETPAVKRRTNRRRSSTGIKDRIWEKKQLQNINIQVDNIFSHWPDGMDESLLNKKLEEMRMECDRRIDEINRGNQKRMKDMNAALEDEKAKNRRNADEIRELNDKMDEALRKLRDATRENKGLKQRCSDLERDKNKIEHELNTKLEAAAGKIRKLEDECDRLRKLGKTWEQREKELERQYNKRLIDALNEKERNFQNFKAQMEDENARSIDEIRAQYGKDIEELERERDRLLDEKGDLLNRNNMLLRERNDFKTKYDTAKLQLEKANEKWRDERDKLQRLLDKKTQEFKDLQDAYNRLNHDYFCINDIKVELETEIEKLKKKLDMFEQKHGIESPFRPKKRRRLNYDTIILDTVNCDYISNNKSGFPLEVSQRQYDGEWKGFELQNVDSRPIKMENWYLSDETKKHRLELPNYPLKRMQSIRVIVNGKSNNKNDLVWNIKISQKKNKNKDLKLYINDKSGNTHLLDTIPWSQRKNYQNCYVM